jgi:hypothetical protein
MQVVDDCVPSVGVGEMSWLVAVAAMSTVVVAADNTSPCGRSRRESGISIRMFAQAMHYLDDVC